MREHVSVVALYCFVSIEKPYLIKAKLGDWVADKDLKGTLIIAPEGVNGTLSGAREVLEGFVLRLSSLLGLSTIPTKWSSATEHPFGKLKFPLKEEVVTMGAPKPNPLEQVGTYVSPEDWNALITDPEVKVVDTRNWYEFELGTFKGSIDPKTNAFRDFESWVHANLDPQKDRKVAMFCTGGIRCEKASSFLLNEGFTSVFHLEGGILNYLETVPKAESLWEGECFVFDDRVTLAHGLEQGTSLMCKDCGRPSKDAKLETGPDNCDHCGAVLRPRTEAPD
ncbi:MAG: rhodanese-related sulfurtransferase [Bradymonadia bacterium]